MEVENVRNIENNNKEIFIKIVDYLNNNIDFYIVNQYCVLGPRNSIELNYNNYANFSNNNGIKKLKNANQKELQYFLKELRNFNTLRILLSNGVLFQLYIIKLKPNPEREYVDYKGNSLINNLVWEKVETDNMFSWLSTLGGGYSALGDSFTNCAQIAAKISLKQLVTALRIGDPCLQARCKLFYSISLIQTGKLKLAKTIITEQYHFAKAQKEIDQRLVKMCKGIWLKLQYAYYLRNEQRKGSKML